MPPPTATAIKLNLLFERPPCPSTSTSKINHAKDDAGNLEQFFLGLDAISRSESPFSSTGSMTLAGSEEADEKPSIFATPDDSDAEDCSIPDATLDYIQNLINEPVHPSLLQLPPSVIPPPELNPHALPFIPSTPARRKASPPPQLRRRKSLEVLKQPWVPLVDEGISASTSEQRGALASAIVSAAGVPWTNTSLIQLAQYVVIKACDAQMAPESHDALAPFVLMLAIQLLKTFGNDVGETFAWYLKEYALINFDHCWNEGRPRSITFAFAPSFNYVAAAQRLAAFIGDLFSLGLLLTEHINTCIDLLMPGQIASLEHLEALHVLMRHASGKLGISSESAMMLMNAPFLVCFGDSLRAQCQYLKHNTSVLGKCLKDGKVEGRVSSLVNMVEGWKEARMGREVSTVAKGDDDLSAPPGLVKSTQPVAVWMFPRLR